MSYHKDKHCTIHTIHNNMYMCIVTNIATCIVDRIDDNTVMDIVSIVILPYIVIIVSIK